MAIDPTTGIDTGATNPALVQPLPVYTAPTYDPKKNFSFDPNTALPGIQNNAAAIYNPQQAQIDALSKLGQAQTDQTKITTEKQFSDELTARIEAINSRGAFFGGGAITNQNDIQTAKTAALTNLDLQNQASQAGFLAQKAGLNAAQTQYIQDQLTNSQSSAYNMWKDSYSMWSDQQDRLDKKYGAGYSTSNNKTQAKMRAKARK